MPLLVRVCVRLSRGSPETLLRLARPVNQGSKPHLVTALKWRLFLRAEGIGGGRGAGLTGGVAGCLEGLVDEGRGARVFF